MAGYRRQLRKTHKKHNLRCLKKVREARLQPCPLSTKPLGTTGEIPMKYPSHGYSV
jgi:hypothetical protein